MEDYIVVRKTEDIKEFLKERDIKGAILGIKTGYVSEEQHMGRLLIEAIRYIEGLNKTE